MNYRQIANWVWLTIIIVSIALLDAAIGDAAGWTEQEGGSATCTQLYVGDTCFVATAGEDSDAIHVGNCKVLSLFIHSTGVLVTPQECTTKACTTSKDLTSTPLTGSPPNNYAAISMPMPFLRLSTSSSATVEIICGG